MRGLLRIVSERSPYLRASVSFADRKPVDVPITDLDGERFLELARDPVLTVTISDEHGAFRPLPDLPTDMTSEHANILIEAARTEAADAPRMPRGSSDVLIVGAGAATLAASGVGELTERLQRQADLMTRTSDELNSTREELVEVKGALERERSAGGDRARELVQAKARVAEVEKLLAAKVAAKKAAPKPDATATQP